MVMKKVSMDELKPIVEKYKLSICRVKGSDDVVQICKKSNEDMEKVSWDVFEQALKKKKMAVYKAEGSDFLKIMKEK